MNPARVGRLTVIAPYDVSRSTVRIVGEFLKWYRIEAIDRTRLTGRERYLAPGKRAWVPKRAIRHIRVVDDGIAGSAPDGTRNPD